MFRYHIPFLILGCCAMLCGQTTLTIQGHVFSADGSRVSGATVTIEGSSRFVEVTDSANDVGHYTTPPLAAGTYKVTVDKDGYHSKLAYPVAIDKESRVVDFSLDPVCDNCGGVRTVWNWDFGGTLAVVVLFLISIWLVRWNNIARPNREMLRAEIENARARFKDQTGQSADQYEINKLLLSAEEAIVWNWRHTPLDFLFWSRGQEITGWSLIHEFERDSVKLLPAGSIEIVRARLQSAELDLLDIDKTHAKTFASNIKDALDAKLGEDMLRPLLVEALTYLNDEDVNTFAQLVGWQTKAVWLAGVGCSLVVVLACIVGNPVLFIAGAAGGYLSRLARTLKRADVPTDYGASWTTLFLSPIVGALSGWFGILLIVVLADSKMKVLGEAFQAVKWCCPLAPFTLGIAFALGFSERLFDGIISSLDDKVDSDRQAATKPQQATSEVSEGNGDKKKEQQATVDQAAPPAAAETDTDPNVAPPAAGTDKKV